MEYTPGAPDHSVNVSREHPLVEASTLIIGLGVIFVVIAVLLIVMIEIVLYFVPAEAEAAMFETWIPEDLVTVAVDDEQLTKAENVLARLSRHYPESPYLFSVEINDSPEINAMAFPGGLIVVTRGLMDQVESENELAFVLGHEMGHYHNRDHIRAMGRALVLSLFYLALSGNDTSNYGATVADLTLKGFSRKQESAADLFGLELVQAEYGHVADSWRLFERLDDPDDDLIDLISYTRTHPSPGDRIEEIIETAGERGWSVSGEVTPIEWGGAPQASDKQEKE